MFRHTWKPIIQCSYVISCAFRLARTYPSCGQRKVWLIYVYINKMCILVLRFFLYAASYRYTLLIKQCARSKHDDQDDYKNNFINEYIGIRQFFTRQIFPNLDSSKFSTVKILHLTVCKEQ